MLTLKVLLILQNFRNTSEFTNIFESFNQHITKRMKKFAVLSMVFMFSLSLIYAQGPKTGKAQTKETKKEQRSERVSLKKLNGSVINPVAKNNFVTDFGNTPAEKWERSAYFDEVVFMKGGKEYRGFYDLDGNLVGTTSVAKFTDLTPAAQKEIQKEYKDYTVGKVIFFDDNEANSSDMYLYGKQFEDADNYFVELMKGAKKLIVQVTPEGAVYFFSEF
jgi:hypothetical protein